LVYFTGAKNSLHIKRLWVGLLAMR